MTRLGIAVWGDKVFLGLEKKGQSSLSTQYLQKPQDLSDCLGEMLAPFLSKELSALGIIKGPGSFTGLRVLLATTHALMLAYPHLQVFAPTFFDVVGFHIQERPLIVLGEPHGTQHLGKLFLNDQEEIFTTLPNLKNAHIIDLRQCSDHWAERLLSMPWEGCISNAFPLPFYGYEPIYKKKSI